METLMDLCRIPSPSGSEGQIRDYIRKRLHSLGYETFVDETGNLYTRTESTEREDMFLSSHMDTVPVPDVETIRVVRKEGRVSSDGTTVLGGDDKLGVAATLEMLALCREFPGSHRGLDAVFTVKEELGSLGSSAVEPRQLRARTGFNLDGESPPGSVICRAPRKARFSCVVHGRAAHAALAPEEGINALVIAGTILSRLPLGVPGPESTSNVGSISGGTQTNIVPDRAEFTGELRSFSPPEFDAIRRKTERICRKTASDMGGSAELEWEDTYDSYHVKEEEPCSRWFSEACARQGLTPRFLSSRGGGDSNQLNSKGLRNLVFGLGMHNIHSSSEYFIEEEYIRGVELLKEIVFPGNETQSADGGI